MNIARQRTTLFCWQNHPACHPRPSFHRRNQSATRPAPTKAATAISAWPVNVLPAAVKAAAAPLLNALAELDELEVVDVPDEVEEPPGDVDETDEDDTVVPKFDDGGAPVGVTGVAVGGTEDVPDEVSVDVVGPTEKSPLEAKMSDSLEILIRLIE